MNIAMNWERSHTPGQRATRRAERRRRPRGGSLPRCPRSGKVRFRDHREAVDALQTAMNSRSRAEFAGFGSRRNECRTYECNMCHGWHLTSQQAQLAA